MVMRHLIEKAIALKDLPQGKYKHFSFILRRKKVLSVGWNLMNKTHPWAIKYGFEFGFQHAECMAIRNFPYPYSELSKCKLINIRLISKDRIALSKPCVNCANLLSLFNVGEVFYTTNDGSFVQL